MLYVLILIAKIIEVSLATTRIVMITKGERIKGAIIGFVEVIIWIILITTVLKDISEDPFKVFVYALGFALGNYVGSWLEEKIGIGTVRIEIIVKEADGQDLADNIRKHGFAVTMIQGAGMNFSRNVLISHIKRKRIKEFINIAKQYQENAVITISEEKPVYGGHGILKK